MTYATVRSAAEHIARAGKITPHQLAALTAHDESLTDLQRQEFTVRFRWEPGSIAFWDNRATAHIVPMDIPKGMHRCHERITIAGDIPVDPAGNKSYVLKPDA